MKTCKRSTFKVGDLVYVRQDYEYGSWAGKTGTVIYIEHPFAEVQLDVPTKTLSGHYIYNGQFYAKNLRHQTKEMEKK